MSMSKNVIFLVNIKLSGNQNNVGRWAESRSNPYKFGIESWKRWGDKHNCEVFVLDTPLMPHEEMPVLGKGIISLIY